VFRDQPVGSEARNHEALVNFRMRKRNVMQSVKKNLFVMLMAALVVSSTVASMHAQSAHLAVSVPFDFSVGKQHLNAGDYRVVTEGRFVSFSRIGGTTTTAMLSPGGDVHSNHNGEPFLRFSQYGTEYFLKTIVLSERDTYELPSSPREKEILSGPKPVEEMVVSAGAAR